MRKNRKSELLGALDRIASAVPLDPARIAVLICPPVSRFRILAAVYLPGWIRRRFGFESDYVRTYTETHGNVGQYWNEVGKAVLQQATLIRRIRIRSVLNARFQDLESVASTHQVVILIAHHVEEKDEIEFACSRRSWLEVQNVIRHSRPQERSCFLLDICDSVQWRDELRRTFPNLKPAGGVSKMNLLESLTMTGLFITRCDGLRSFEEAWALAESGYWNPDGRHGNE